MTLAVLHVHAGNMYGGVETILATLARLPGVAPDVEHRFALCFEGRIADELRAAGARVDTLGPTRISRPWTIAHARRRLGALLAAAGIDVAVCHSTWSQAIFGPVLRARGTPSVFWLHGVARGPAWLESWARRSPPARAICVSRFAASTLPRLFGALPYGVVFPPVAPPPPAPPERRMAARLALGSAPEQLVILHASRVEAGKGLRVLLGALAELRDDPDWVCWVAGGPQRPVERRLDQSLRQTAFDLGLGDRVRFLGTRDDLPELLAAADIFCQPSLEPEGFGIAVVEALYAGLPVVACPLGGTAEIVTEACSISFPPGDQAALAGALRQLLRDPSARRRLAAAGPARAAACCDPGRQVRALAEELRKAADAREAAR